MTERQSSFRFPFDRPASSVPMARSCYRSHINNLHPVIYDGFVSFLVLRERSSWTEQMPGNPRKRLEKIEQKMAEITRREGLSNCICKDRMLVARTKIFEAEMNKTCPAHGFRQLGKITVLELGDVKGNVKEESLGLTELVQEYERRFARHRQRMLEEDDPEDL
jgi:hypothetical protein